MLLFVLFPILVWGQEYVPWESYYWRDSVTVSDEYDFEFHSSIYPRINKRRIDYGKTLNKRYLPKRHSFMPISDAVFGLGEGLSMRAGVGIAVDYIPLRGMHIRAAYIGGVFNQLAENYRGGVKAFSFLRWDLNGISHYHDLRFRLSYSPNKYFNFQVGLDQNRFGEGDRSLLLDDYGAPYPFAAARIKFWRAEYVLLHTYMHTPNAGQNNFRPKHSTMHYLSLNLFKNFNLSFFEAVIYDGLIDGQRRGFEFEYLNPMVIYRPTEFGLGSTDKIQLGINISYRLLPQVMLYGQVLLDEFLLKEVRDRTRWKGNKFGYQLGIKGQTVWQEGILSYLSEFNLVRPFTYAHNNPGQSFTHMNFPLAHPYGANFIENSSRVLYRKNRWDYSLDFVYLLRGSNFVDSTSWGGDINISNILLPFDENNDRIQYGYTIGGGAKYNLTKIQATVGYQVFQKYRIRAFATIDATWIARQGSAVNYMGVYMGLRSELWNDRRNY